MASGTEIWRNVSSDFARMELKSLLISDLQKFSNLFHLAGACYCLAYFCLLYLFIDLCLTTSVVEVKRTKNF
jgi:hypothetical protein